MRSGQRLAVVSWVTALAASAAASATLAPEQRPQTGSHVEPPGAAPQAMYAARTTRDRIGRIVAPVLLNGQGPFGFVIDTGATHAAISVRTAQALNLQTQPEHTVMLNGMTGSESVATVEVARLQAGELVLENQRMPVLGSVMANADGILGVEDFADKRILVDFVHDRVEITRSRGERAPRGFITVAARTRLGGLLVVDASIGRMPLKAVVDTGSQGTLGTEVLASTLGIRVDPRRQPDEVSGATSPIQQGHTALLPRVSVEGMVITNVDVTFGDIYIFRLWNLDRQPAIVIGMDVLGQLDTLIIDYHLRELQLRFPERR